MNLIPKIALAGIALVAIGTVGTVVTNKRAPVASSSTINLYKDSGVVYYKKAASSEYQLLSGLSVELSDGAFVKTEIGKAHVIFPDNSLMSIDENTLIQISYSPKKTSILQTLGNTYHRVSKLQGGNEYEVKTPGTLAAVRGTKFAVLYSSKTKVSKVSVTESKVAVSKIKDGKPATSTETSVTFGFVAEVKDVPQATGTQISLFEIKNLTDEKERAWLLRNAEFDAYLDEVEKKREFLEALSKAQAEIKNAGGVSDLDLLKLRLDQTRGLLKTRIRTIDQKLMQQLASTTLQILNRASTTRATTTTVTIPTPRGGTQTIPVTIPFPKFEGGPTGEQDPFSYYFDRYYSHWFQLDANDSVCLYMTQVPVDEVIGQLTVLAKNYGRELPNAETLAKNMTDLQTYCRTKDPVLRRSLEARFKADYPYANEY